MQITFAEEIKGQQLNERSYAAPVVAVGRNPATCKIVFDQKQWPTVSRQHAQFLLHNDSWFLTDSGSTYGTFLNGQPIKEPTKVEVGSRLQFGPDGPILVVTRIESKVDKPLEADETLVEESTRLSSPAQIPDLQASVQARPTQAPLSKPTEPVFVELSGLGTARLQRIELNNEVIRFGRDQAVEGVIDAAAAVVSRRHAEIRRQNGRFFVVDLGSFNGTLLNDRRIAEPELLHHNDRIELGPGGPTIRYLDPANPAPVIANQPAQNPGIPSGELAQRAPGTSGKLATMVLRSETPMQITGGAGAGMFTERPFGSTTRMTIGRGEECNIRLDGLLISNHHAAVVNARSNLTIEDLNSTNGTYVNGARITGRKPIRPEDVIQIGPFVLRVHPQRGITVFDTRAKTRIDVFQVTKEVANRSGPGKVRLLDEVCLSIQPNEFVGMLGPSGAGKSTLMDSLNGMRPASSGQVLVNNLDLYQHLESLKLSIGYVPQDDIIHRELTVYRTLYYVARLRLSRDISAKEINQIVAEVMDVTGLSERRDVPISQLSGGQRKRVSIAVELITKPSIIFLDEPTSGLDPATEEKVMKLFRQIAESGRTVILTTHAMENVKLFDKIVLLMRGKLVFYGRPDEALEHVGAESFKDLYDKLEAPISERLTKDRPASREQVAEEVAEEWKRRFMQTSQYKLNIAIPLTEVSSRAQQAVPAKSRTTLGDLLRQWATLSHRYMGVLARDKFNLFILFAQAPIIALLTYLVVDAKGQRDFPYFILALVALWFGTSVAAREVIRERAVYNRERMVNLRLLPYISSKLFVLLLIVSFQCILLFGTLKLLDLTAFMEFPGRFGGLPQLFVMILTGMVGIALGLLISAVVRTSEMATSLVPLILIPQILFSGLVGVPVGIAKFAGVVMPATWSFDEMKRLSGLDVLRGRDESAEPASKNEGRGLYKQIEHENDKNIQDAQQRINAYRSDAQKKSKDFEQNMDQYQKDLMKGDSPKKPTAPEAGPAPEVAGAKKVPDNLNSFVDFLHPWGGHWTNFGVLLAMLFGLLGATGVALRSQDIG